MSDELKQRLIDAGIVLDAAGLGDFTRGHVSVRDPSDPSLFFMKPHSVGFEEVTIESVVICNLEGEKVGGAGRRHSEVFIHSEIFRARPDLNAVIHAHPKYAVALSSVDRPWRVVSQSSAVFSDGVGLYEDTIDLIRSQETGRGVAQALAGHKAVLMRGHGVAVAGNSLEEAVIRTITLENACEDQFIVHGFGGETIAFAEDDVARLRNNLDRAEQYVVNFDYLLRRAHRHR
ncbi:class II aldolase/adducin family protein [Pseudochelatococcus sp. B33]